MRSLALLVGVPLAVAACSDHPVVPDGPLSGAWGGSGVSLMALPDGSRVELDCAHGNGELLVIRGGRFEADAEWFREGGPVPEEPVDPVPAVFSGSVSGKRMTLSIRLEDRADPLGPFALEEGREPVLRKCL